MNMRHDGGRDLVHAVVVVAELREIAFGLVIHDQSGFVANHLHPRVADRRQAVRDDRQARDAERHRADRRVIVQRHLDPLVGVLVVHVVDDVHRVHVHARQPVHHSLELRRRRRRTRGSRPVTGSNVRADLLAGDFVAAAVDGVEKALGEVRARAEELHLLAHEHRRNAAGNRAVVAPGAAHERVALELQRAGIDGDLRGELPEIVRQPR